MLLRALEMRVLTSAVRQFPPPTLALKRLFPDEEVAAQVADYNVFRNTRLMAEYSASGGPANPVPMLGVTPMTVRLPRIREKTPIPGIDQRFAHLPEDLATAGGSRLVAQELAKLQRRVDLRKEWERAQALTGTITAEVSGATVVITNTVTPLTASVDFSDPDVDVLGAIKAWMTALGQVSGAKPVEMWCNSATSAYFLANANILALVRDAGGALGFIRDGRIARLPLLNLDLVEYDEGYADATGTFYPFIADNAAFLVPAPGDASMKTFLGLSEDLQAPLVGPGRFSKAWEDNDPSATQILVEEYSLSVVQVPTAIGYCSDVTST
jgi:hypothetical protein